MGPVGLVAVSSELGRLGHLLGAELRPPPQRQGQQLESHLRLLERICVTVQVDQSRARTRLAFEDQRQQAVDDVLKAANATWDVANELLVTATKTLATIRERLDAITARWHQGGDRALPPEDTAARVFQMDPARIRGYAGRVRERGRALATEADRADDLALPLDAQPLGDLRAAEETGRALETTRTAALATMRQMAAEVDRHANWLFAAANAFATAGNRAHW